MADIFTSDFEGATPFSGWTTAAATVTQNTGIFHGGAASAKFDGTTATAPMLTKTIAGSPTVLVGQFWLYVPASMPSGYTGATIYRVVCSFFNIFFKLNHTTTQELQMQMDSGASTTEQTASYIEDAWQQVTIRVNVGASPMTVDWNIDGSEKTQVSFVGGPTTVTSLSFGYTGGIAAGFTYYGDDLRLSITSSDYDVYKAVVATTTTSGMLLLGAG